MLEEVFNATSVAIIGASSNPEKTSGKPIKYLQKHGYEGEIYPVNPNHDQIAGLKCYENVESTPTTPELGFISLPSELILDVVEECIQSGIKSLIIGATGFAETQTQQGVEAQDNLSELAGKRNITLIGPGSQGIVNFHNRLFATYSPAFERDDIISGNVGFVTQSGAFGGALTTLFLENNIGLSKVIMTGNEAVTGALDFFKHLSGDDVTDITAGFIEGFNDGRKLIEIKRSDVGIEMPIVILKVGKGERSRQAAMSHTGTIADSYNIYRAIFREVGIIEVDDVDLFFSVIDTLTKTRNFPTNNVAIVSTSGGAGAHLADVAEEVGLNLPPLSDDTKTNIDRILPESGSTLNPIDFATKPDISERFAILEQIINDNNIDTIIFQITNQSGESAVEYAERLREVYEDYDKPLYVCNTGGFETAEARAIYDHIGVPVFENPATCVRTVAALRRHSASKDRLESSKHLPARIGSWDGPQYDGSRWDSVLTEDRGKVLLREYGIPTVEEAMTSSANEAVEFAERFGYPVVAKLVSSELHHRNQVGGVKTDLGSSEIVFQAVENLLDLGHDLDIENAEISIQPQVFGSIELAAGIVDSSDFGPVVMFGRGGVDIEGIRDVTFRTIPVSKPQACSMFEDLRTIDESTLSKEILRDLVNIVTSISTLYLENQWIHEADINPIIVSEEGPIAVDTLIRKTESDI